MCGRDDKEMKNWYWSNGGKEGTLVNSAGIPSKRNALTRHLIRQGHNAFVISAEGAS